MVIYYDTTNSFHCFSWLPVLYCKKEYLHVQSEKKYFDLPYNSKISEKRPLRSISQTSIESKKPILAQVQSKYGNFKFCPQSTILEKRKSRSVSQTSIKSKKSKGYGFVSNISQNEYMRLSTCQSL